MSIALLYVYRTAASRFPPLRSQPSTRPQFAAVPLRRGGGLRLNIAHNFKVSHRPRTFTNTLRSHLKGKQLLRFYLIKVYKPYLLLPKLMCSLCRRGVLLVTSIAMHFALPSPCRSPGVALPPPPPGAARMVRGLVDYLDRPPLRSPLPIARAPPPAAS